MASVEVPVVIGEEFVEAAKQAVEKATAPFRSVGEYRIGSDGDSSGDSWPYVEHLPCEQDIWSGQQLGGAGLNVAELLKLIAAHQCPKSAAAVKFAADMERLTKKDPAGARWVEHILTERAERQGEDGDRG